MARPTLTADQRAKMRERIRLQALHLYSEGGVEAVSIRAVAQRVGVSPTGIYSYFKSRQALIEALWLDPVLIVLAEMVQVAQLTPDPLDRIVRLLDVYVDFAFRQPEIYRGAFLHVRPTREAPPSPRPMNRLDFQRLLCDAVVEGQARDRLRQGDPAAVAQSLWAGVHGALALPIHMEAWTFIDRAQLVAQIRAMLMDGIRAPTAGIHKV